VIGKDTRLSCDMLESAMVAGICSMGAEPICVGVVPTPAVAFLTGRYGADAGVVISASHNSYEFNGIKFFDGNGYKLPDATESRIEQLILDSAPGWPDRPTHGAIGRRHSNYSAKEDYLGHLAENGAIDLAGFRIALDCANGAAFEVAPMLFGKLGAAVSAIHCEPNGTNINSGCGSTHMEELTRHTLRTGADIGFAFDGDADRVLAVDERGGLIDGDTIMAMIAIDMKNSGRLRNDTLVATIMSNIGLEIMAGNEGINLVRTAVGDRYVLEEMIKSGYNLGGEQSGHVICLDGNTTGDGLYTALLLSRILAESGKKASSMANVVKIMPQVILNARVPNDKKFECLDDPVISVQCRLLEKAFTGEGRVLIRPSGTEPLVRVMIEARDRDMIRSKAEELASLIESRFA
jgi:phosphoglucosamine mutase